MPFIKIQKLVRNEDGTIRSGSAAVMDTMYVKEGKYHSKQVLRERLGKVVEIDPSRRRGIFLSPTRGLVMYDADQDSFREVSEGETLSAPQSSGRHAVFGDSYAFLELARRSGVLASMRRALPDDGAFSTVLLRAARDFSSPFSSMDAFAERSFLSWALRPGDPASLGSDGVRNGFFQEFCPNGPEIVSDAARYEGPRATIGSVDGKAVWCDSVIDPSAWTAPEGARVAVLSQEYVAPHLFKAYDQDSPLTVIASMPSRKGLPYKEACQKAMKSLDDKDCIHEMNGREYFGVRKKTEVFGKKAYAYVYSDTGSGVPFPAFSVLLSNKSLRPDAVMEAYVSALMTESGARRGAGFDMSAQEVRGSALLGIASRIVRDAVRDESPVPLPVLAGSVQSVMCSGSGGSIDVEAPGPVAAKAMSDAGVDVPSVLDAEDYRRSLLSP